MLDIKATTPDGEAFPCIIGIDASRNRSGGARAHIIGVLSALDPRTLGVTQVHVWAYQQLLDCLPDAAWLVKHSPPELNGALWRQLWWQRTKFSRELTAAGCHVLLSTSAASVSRFAPAVVMSRDMLSFEKGEMNRYGLSYGRLRLLMLRSMQVHSLRRAAAPLFLTSYAANVIQKVSGPLPQARVIPHGIGENFRVASRQAKVQTGSFRCIYVSNAEMYKHQWHVIEAVRRVRDAGYNLTLDLVGAGAGPAAHKVCRAIERFDAAREFVTVTPAVPHDAVPAYLAAADIFVFASSCENMPNTLVEAMASNVPIACSSRGPMPEILKDAGEYFDPEQPESIATALIRLLQDADLRAGYAASAKRLSDQFSWRRCAKETWELLLEVARGNADAPPQNSNPRIEKYAILD